MFRQFSVSVKFILKIKILILIFQDKSEDLIFLVSKIAAVKYGVRFYQLYFIYIQSSSV